MPALPPSIAPPSLPLLNPLPVKSKGRPKGGIETSSGAKAKQAKKAGQGKDSSKRDLSLHEHERQLEQRDAVPSASAPPQLQQQQLAHDPYEKGTAHPRGYQRTFQALYYGDVDAREGALGTGEGEGVLDGLANARYEDKIDQAVEKHVLEEQELEELEKVMPVIVCG